MCKKTLVVGSISLDLCDKISEEAAATGESQSAIITAALESYFSICHPFLEIPATEREDYEKLVATVARVQACYPRFIIPEPKYRYCIR